MDSSEEILDRLHRGRHVVPRILTSGVGEPETTVPASPQALIAVGIADVDTPPTIVDAFEEDLAKNTGEIEVVESSDREANILGLHGRRVVLVPQDSDCTPQSIQDVFSPQSQPLQGHTWRQARDLFVSRGDSVRADLG